jgi:superfamily II helicase
VKNALKVALEKRGYETLTPVQREVSNPELENADLLVSAHPGKVTDVAKNYDVNFLPPIRAIDAITKT